MKKFKLVFLIAVISLSLGLGTNAAVKNKNHKDVKVPTSTQKIITQAETSYELTNPLDIVANPTKYLNKKVKIKAKFDKFSTLGLDYKPAFKSSEKYITFLIKRSDVLDHTIPLSELKNFLDRATAEKYIDLKPDDDIEYSGTVFSNALGDAWINVEKFVVLNQQTKNTDATKK